jgi:hypothetical protein
MRRARAGVIWPSSAAGIRMSQSTSQKSSLAMVSPVHLAMPLLASVAPHFGDGHSIHADALEGFLDFLEPERLDDSFDLFHLLTLLRRCLLSAVSAG